MLEFSFRSRVRVAAAQTHRSAPESPARSTIFHPVPSQSVQVSVIVIRSPPKCLPPKPSRPPPLRQTRRVQLGGPSSHSASSWLRQQSTPPRPRLPGLVPPARGPRAPAWETLWIAVPNVLPALAGRAARGDRKPPLETRAR